MNDLCSGSAVAVPLARTPTGRRMLRIASIVLVLCFPRPGFSSGQDLFGMGAGVAALAGNGALATGFEAVYHGPSILADLTEKRLTLGGVHSALSATVEGADPVRRSSNAVLLGVQSPVPLRGWWNERLGMALGVFLPTDVVVSARVPALGEVHLPVLEQRARTVGVHLAAGLRVAEAWSVGAGFLALAAVHGEIRIRPAATGGLGSRVENDLLADFAPVLSVDWSPSFRLRLTVRGVSRADFTIPLDARLGDSICLGSACLDVPVMQVRGNAQYDPRQAVLEGSYDLGPWTLVGGVAWKQWSAAPRPLEPPVPASPDHPHPAYSDIWVLSAGAAWSPSGAYVDWVRFGVRHEPSPLPVTVTPASWLDADRTVVGSGLGFVFGGDEEPNRWYLDIFGQVHALHPRDHQTGRGELALSGVLWASGVQLGVAF